MRVFDETTVDGRRVPSGTAQPQPGGYVVSYVPGERSDRRRHEPATLRQIAERLARLKGFEFAGEYDVRLRYDRPVYVVPSTTLLRDDAAERLGIRGEDDLFGGVVPHAFVATKTITHPLADDGAMKPEGWSHAFARTVAGAVLSGYSAFSIEDARRAGERLLRDGPVRVKPAREVGGRGQVVANDVAQLDAALRELGAMDLASCGVVLEENLEEVETYSVGQVRVGNLVASYCRNAEAHARHAGRVGLRRIGPPRRAW